MKTKLVFIALIVMVVGLLAAACAPSAYSTIPSRTSGEMGIVFEGYENYLYKWHDTVLKVTCYGYNGIYCLPDSVIGRE